MEVVSIPFGMDNTINFKVTVKERKTQNMEKKEAVEFVTLVHECTKYCELAIYLFRKQNINKSMEKMTLFLSGMESLLYKVEKSKELDFVYGDYSSIEEWLATFQDIMIRIERKNYILAADLMELKILPILYQIQEYLITTYDIERAREEILCAYENSLQVLNEKNTDLVELLKKSRNANEEIACKYHLESTSMATQTLAVQTLDEYIYLHSNKNPWTEAMILVEDWIKSESSTYLIYGLGLGYHLITFSAWEPDAEIKVYESDINIFRILCENNGKYIFGLKNVEFHYDPDFTKLWDQINCADINTTLKIYYPSMCCIEDKINKNRLESYFIQYNSGINQNRILKRNFLYNKGHYDFVIDVLEEKFKHKELYIVAGGPSLDKNFILLKKIKEDSNKIIVATDTVFCKLMNSGIRPDYIIVSDAKEKVSIEVSSYMDQSVPVLFLSTANKNYAKEYQGAKYIILQAGYQSAEDKSKLIGSRLYNTGGSVSTVALDIGIQFQCSKIIFLGLDLAYTDLLSHAIDTRQRKVIDTAGIIETIGIDGKMIKTTAIFDMYRKWMEDRIKNVDDIQFIDATEGGALIKGFSLIKLKELI